MPAKIHINIQEKNWSVIDLKKVSKIAFKSTFKILAYSKIYKFLEVNTNYNERRRGDFFSPTASTRQVKEGVHRRSIEK